VTAPVRRAGVRMRHTPLCYIETNKLESDFQKLFFTLNDSRSLTVFAFGAALASISRPSSSLSA
jgi:hypothetical protein